MTIASEISRLQTAKANIKTAIEGKGVTVPSETLLSGYATLVNNIDAGGVNVSDADAAAANVLSGKTFYAGTAEKKTGTITSKAAETFTPGTANQTIAAGQYLDGTQTILGDADLIAGNIKNGVDIFGVTGTFSGTLRTGTISSDGGTPGTIDFNSLPSKPKYIFCWDTAISQIVFYDERKDTRLWIASSSPSYSRSSYDNEWLSGLGRFTLRGVWKDRTFYYFLIY